MIHAGDALALDAGSLRSFDDFGHLNVASSPISKAMICPYRGDEIPGWEQLGLNRDRIYRLFRDPAELAKGAATFAGKPLMLAHRPVTASNHAAGLVAGSIGTDVNFTQPYLVAPLSVWTQEAIDLIESGEQKQLSAAYGYDPDMRPGSFQGQAYDGVMRNIRGNHVTLVKTGRAGPDVVVGDSMENLMSKPQKLSLMAATAHGALLPYIAGKLAQDKALDLRPLLVGITAKNWRRQKPALVKRLTVAAQNKMAKDADLQDVVALLDKLDGSVGDNPDDPDNPAPDDDDGSTPPGVNGATGGDGDHVDKVLAFLKDLLRPEDIAIVQHMLQPPSEAHAPEPPAEATPPDDDAAADPDDGDGDGDGGDTPEADDADPEAKKDPDMTPNPDDDDKKKPAMDAAINTAVARARRETIAEMNAIRQAEIAVEPLIGKLAAPPATASAVYKLALDEDPSVDLTGVHASAYPALVRMLVAQRNAAAAAVPASPRVAMDAAQSKRYLERFPNADRLRQRH
jgi:hypothetical protein